MKEVWKDVDGYEGLYKISNHGNVLSVRSGQLLKPSINEFGYERVWLKNRNVKKLARIHRVVASAFIPNAGGMPEVNHIDGNKRNNNQTNLEWVSTKENIRHAYKIGLKGQNRKPCACSDGRVFESLLDAEGKTGIWAGNIRHACEGKRKTAGGYRWWYLNIA